MKGRNPTAEEQKYLDLVGEYGCIICKMWLGVESPCSPHHVNGRTKPGAHFEIFGLCGQHHQVGNEGVALHRNKYQFEQNFDTEKNLIHMQRVELGVDILDGKVIII